MNLFTRWRKHDFDMEHPTLQHSDVWVRGNDGQLAEIVYPSYKCKRCGKRLCLNEDQMKTLPFSMGHGCPVAKEKKNVGREV